MYLESVMSKELHYLSEEEEQFISLIVKEIDVECIYGEFFQSNFGAADAINISCLIEQHVKQNNIFMIKTNGKEIPVIRYDPIKKLIGCEALSREKIAMIDELCEFMYGCDNGFELSY
jgi:hypothetical protein